jgi:anion-transporting  ArsA/GET3 family ATPase
MFQRRFVIVTGKGGVGRSTLAAALGLAAARYGMRTCVVQLNTRDELGRIFAVDASGYEPVPLVRDLPLFGCNLRPADALREYGQMKLHFRTLHKLVFENDVMQRLMRMIPGMNELVLLGKAWHMEAQERGSDGKLAWDLLVIDAPATGHGVSLLRLPQTILSAVPVGPMADDARQMQALLEDPARTSLHVVTLPQDLPATEALELCDEARNKLGVPTGNLFVNMVLPQLVEDRQLRALQRGDADTPLLADAITAVAAHAKWHDAQQVQVRRLQKASALPVVELPHLFEAIGRAQIETLADVMVAGMEAAESRPDRRPEWQEAP